VNINRTWRYSWKYTLGRDDFFIVHMPGAKAYRGQWMEIIPLAGDRAQVRISAGYSWDGCSIVPDAPGTKAASCLHDALYQFSKEIAAAWGVRTSVVIGLADDAFLAIMRRDHCPVAGLYYAGVRFFGRPYRFFSSLFGS
jgi:hypothetical protein